MKVTAEVKFSRELATFMTNLGSKKVREAARLGLNEHADEQRRQSVVRITAFTGIPKGRVSSKIRVVKAGGGASMEAKIVGSDVPVMLHEYGNPKWQRDLRPGWGGGAVSSSAGVEAVSWNKPTTFRGSFLAKGKVMVRQNYSDPRSKLKVLSMAIIGYELYKPSRPNAPAADAYAALDFQNRVMRHVLRALGT